LVRFLRHRTLRLFPAVLPFRIYELARAGMRLAREPLSSETEPVNHQDKDKGQTE
jgi:hypothetical protein